MVSTYLQNFTKVDVNKSTYMIGDCQAVLIIMADCTRKNKHVDKNYEGTSK